MEIINYVPYFVSVVITVIFHNLCYIKINDSKFKINIKNTLILILTAVFLFINNSYNNLWLKFVLILIIFSINFMIIYKDKLKKVTISYIFLFLVTILIEIIFTNALNKSGVLNTYETVGAYTVIKITLSTLVSVSEYAFFSIPIIKKTTKNLIDFFEYNIKTINIIYLLFLTACLLSILNVVNFASKDSLKLIVLLLFIFLLLFGITIKLITKEEYLKKSNKRLKDYNEKYGLFLDEYKIYKHNIKNKLIAIKAVGNKKVKQLIDDLLEEETTFSVKNSNLYNLPNGIKGIVAEKLYNPQIDVIIDNKLKGDPFIKLKPKVFNKVSESIGICIDNAIEASVATEEPVITIDLYEDKKYFYIKIGNSYCNEIDIDKLGDKYYSTKNRGSGLGLFSIMRNKAVHEKITIINDFFYIELQIKKAR